MTSGPPDPVVGRAAVALRSTPLPRWVDISASAISRVRATGIRTWPVDACFPTSSSTPDTLRISDAIVRAALLRAVADVPGIVPTGVDLFTEDHTCTGASVTVVGQYGTDLRGASGDIAKRASEELILMLGLPFDAAAIYVAVTDVE